MEPNYQFTVSQQKESGFLKNMTGFRGEGRVQIIEHAGSRSERPVEMVATEALSVWGDDFLNVRVGRPPTITESQTQRVPQNSLMGCGLAACLHSTRRRGPL